MERRGAARVIYDIDVASGDAVETVDPKELADLVWSCSMMSSSAQE